MASTRHFNPLRPHRIHDGSERYEFTHGVDTVCVYDLATLRFIKDIPVGDQPDCHATSLDKKFLYIACHAPSL